MEELGQCKGTTLKGLRCQKKTRDGYCNYHQSQAFTKPLHVALKSTPLEPIKKTGFIYVYSLSHLVDDSPKKQDWLQVRGKPSEKADKWRVFNPSKNILIKVGMTTQSVSKRLRQWESQCNHKLLDVDPYQDYLTRFSLLSSFKKLSLKQKAYACYEVESHGFKCSHSVNLAESEIHKQLRRVYGVGDMLCSGCKTAELSQKQYNVHVEWFLVPRKDLSAVFQIIDSVCKRYI